MRESISRVLSWTIIYLDCMLPYSSSHTFEAHRANVLLHLALHRIGFAGPCGLPHAGELLPRLSTLTAKTRRYISVALSLGSPPAAVSRYPAL